MVYKCKANKYAINNRQINCTQAPVTNGFCYKHKNFIKDMNKLKKINVNKIQKTVEKTKDIELPDSISEKIEEGECKVAITRPYLKQRFEESGERKQETISDIIPDIIEDMNKLKWNDRQGNNPMSILFDLDIRQMENTYSKTETKKILTRIYNNDFGSMYLRIRNWDNIVNEYLKG
jgi:hypothetical protein